MSEPACLFLPSFSQCFAVGFLGFYHSFLFEPPRGEWWATMINRRLIQTNFFFSKPTCYQVVTILLQTLNQFVTNQLPICYKYLTIILQNR
jgi:hypothetical protein